MGGTEILRPMSYAMNTKYSSEVKTVGEEPEKHRQKRIFLLTDGEVENPDKVIL